MYIQSIDIMQRDFLIINSTLKEIPNNLFTFPYVRSYDTDPDSNPKQLECY